MNSSNYSVYFAGNPFGHRQDRFPQRRRFQFGKSLELDEQLFPRTEILLIHSMSVYQGFLKAGKTPWEASSHLAQHIARSPLLKMEQASYSSSAAGDSSRDRVRLA